MERAMAIEKKEEKKKRKRKRRRIRRLLFLLFLVVFLALTEPGQDLVYRASEIQPYQVMDFFKRIGQGMLAILPSTRDWLADRLTYIANFL